MFPSLLFGGKNDEIFVGYEGTNPAMIQEGDFVLAFQRRDGADQTVVFPTLATGFTSFTTDSAQSQRSTSDETYYRWCSIRASWRIAGASAITIQNLWKLICVRSKRKSLAATQVLAFQGGFNGSLFKAPRAALYFGYRAAGGAGVMPNYPVIPGVTPDAQDRNLVSFTNNGSSLHMLHLSYVYALFTNNGDMGPAEYPLQSPGNVDFHGWRAIHGA